MKTKHEWMNEGKEFEIPEYRHLPSRKQLDIYQIKLRTEKKFADLKPDGPRPKDEDLTPEWEQYLAMVSMEHNFEIVKYLFQKIDPDLTEECLDKNLKSEEIGRVVNALFPVEEEDKENQTEETQAKSSKTSKS